MPLGSTHDRITLWTLPVITLGTGVLSRDAAVTLAVGSAYLFSGLMFSGDLDIQSRQYQRWLWLRWIWLPYRRLMRHRSLWSHGPFLGTGLRVIYLGVWILLGVMAVLGLGHWCDLWLWQPHLWREWIENQILIRGELLLWIGLGLELGSTNHSLSDWLVSRWKRWRKSRQKRQERVTSSATKLISSSRRSSSHGHLKSARSFKSRSSRP